MEKTIVPGATVDSANIKLTERAAAQLQTIMKESRKVNFGLRLGVRNGGCQGMSYVIDFDQNPAGNDKVFSSHGISIYCDEKSWVYLAGAVVDFSNDLMRGGFKISNPNARHSCGCGSSFTA